MEEALAIFQDRLTPSELASLDSATSPKDTPSFFCPATEPLIIHGGLRPAPPAHHPCLARADVQRFGPQGHRVQGNQGPLRKRDPLGSFWPDVGSCTLLAIPMKGNTVKKASLSALLNPNG